MVGVILFLFFPVKGTYDVILLLTVALIPGLITNGIFVIIDKLNGTPQKKKDHQATPFSTRQSDKLNFNNPNIRKQKFAKQLGFDPIAFAPLNEDNMVYIHMDGNEKNDDPETHAWVSKETYDRLRSGKIAQSQKSGIGQQRKLIEQHYQTYLGGVDKILDDHRGDKYHIDIYILPPNDKRNYGVMATSGMSDLGMKMPPKLKFFAHSELYIKLPPDWPYPREALKQDDYTWVIQNLFMLPRSVHNNHTFFWNGQVIDNDEPFARNTELSGFLIKYPSTIDIPTEFNMLKVNPQKAICFFQLIPLYNEEMNFLEKHGLEKLYAKFDEFGISDIVDLKRPNTCLKKSEIGQQRKLIEQHFETHLGGVDKILDDHRGSNIPLEFWKNENIIFKADNEEYVDMNKLNEEKNMAQYIEKITMKYKYEGGAEFEKKEFWYLLKFFFINSRFHDIDPSGLSILNGGVPSKLKIKCTCGEVLDDFKWLKGYCPPTFAQTVQKNVPEHEYFLRISNPCPSCNSVMCIYRPKGGVFYPLMVYLNFLVPSEEFDIFDPSLFMQWVMVVSKVLDMKGISDLFYEDISKLIELIESNPKLDENYKQASILRFKNR